MKDFKFLRGYNEKSIELPMEYDPNRVYSAMTMTFNVVMVDNDD